MRDIFMHELTREAITRRAHHGSAVVVPLAATEQHGPHLPVFTDSLITEHVVTEAIAQAAKQVDILMAPILTFGCSEHHLSFGGTISYKSATYLSMLRDISESLVKAGFKKIFFVNGHGGNTPIMQQAINDLVVQHRLWGAAASYWSVAGQALEELGAAEVGLVPGHAGGFETAAILALRPELVQPYTDRNEHTIRDWIHTGKPGVFVGKHGELTGIDGFTDAPYRATAAAGQLYLHTIVGCLSEWLVQTIQTMEQGGEA